MKFFTVLIFSIIFFSCLVYKSKISTPAKPKGVPKKAFWIGGADGGNWYLVEYVHPHKNNAFIKIYNDNNGNLIASKRFILICNLSESSTHIDNLQDQIMAFDGEKIYLRPLPGQKSCYLQ